MTFKNHDKTSAFDEENFNLSDWHFPKMRDEKLIVEKSKKAIWHFRTIKNSAFKGSYKSVSSFPLEFIRYKNQIIYDTIFPLWEKKIENDKAFKTRFSALKERYQNLQGSQKKDAITASQELRKDNLYTLYNEQELGARKQLSNKMGIAYHVVANSNVPNDVKDFIENMDGFACTVEQIPMIVLFEKKDDRRMNFTYAHELYHLLFDEGEKYADAFAGCFLLSKNEVKKTIEDNNLNIQEQLDDSIVCLGKTYLHVSVTCIVNTLSNYEYIDDNLKKNLLSNKEKLTQLRKEIANST